MSETDRTLSTPGRCPPSSRPPGTTPVSLPEPWVPFKPAPSAAPSKPSRRGVLASAAGLLALGGATVAAPAAAAAPDAALDAGLIATCAEHAVNVAAYNRDGGTAGESGDDPLWLAYERTRDAISAAEPRTLEGVAAKARAAKAEAGPRGDFESGPAAAWSWQVVQDLLRLRGEA